MKKRIKYLNSISKHREQSIYERYKEQFDYFLGNRKEEFVYVHDIDIENDLKEIMDDQKNSITYLLGKAGIGKTTLIKEIFSKENNTVKYDEKRQNLILSINLHGKLLQNNIQKLLTNTIHGLCCFLEKRFSVRDRFLTMSEQLRFYDYIENTSLDLLGHVSTIELLGKSEEQVKLYKLQKAEEKDRYSYESSRLKFYLQEYCREINKVIIVIDNIEVFPEESQEDILRDALGLFSCLGNQIEEHDENRFYVNIIFSLKVSTYNRIIKKTIIRTYAPAKKIYKVNTVDMLLFIQQEYEKIIKSKMPLHEFKDWNDAYSILESLCTRFNGKYAVMLQNLCNYNFEAMKACYIEILSNSVWLGEYDMNQFNIAKIDSIFNNISVIRSLACKNLVYRSKETKIIPNALLNDELNDDSFASMLILSYFYRHYSPQDLYGIKASIQPKKINMLFETIYPEEKKITDSVERVMNYFLENDILKKGLYLDDDNLTEYIFLTSKGREIWKMLSSDSVLLEMYREEHFLDDSNLQIDWTASYELMKNGQVYIFIQLLIYIRILLEQEKRFKETAIEKNTLDYYYSCFGKRVITKHLLDGVMRSIEYSGNNNNSDILNELNLLEKKMKQVNMLSQS